VACVADVHVPQNRDLQARVAELESTLTKMVTDFGAEKSRLRAQVKRDVRVVSCAVLNSGGLTCVGRPAG
jgi:hypothetical protein